MDQRQASKINDRRENVYVCQVTNSKFNVLSLLKTFNYKVNTVGKVVKKCTQDTMRSSPGRATPHVLQGKS